MRTETMVKLGSTKRLCILFLKSKVELQVFFNLLLPNHTGRLYKAITCIAWAFAPQVMLMAMFTDMGQCSIKMFVPNRLLCERKAINCIAPHYFFLFIFCNISESSAMCAAYTRVELSAVYSRNYSKSNRRQPINRTPH